MTKQEYLAELIRRTEADLFPAYSGPVGSCRYRDDKGNPCAAGILIPDEEYSPEMEGCMVPPIAIRTPKQQLLMDAMDIPEGVTWRMLCNVQFEHDNRANKTFGAPWTREEKDSFIKDVRGILA